MSLSATLNVLRVLIWETFWQAVASRIFWVLLTVTGVCVVFCLGLKGERDPKQNTEFIRPDDPQYDPQKAAKSGVTPITGQISLAFGAIPVPLGRDAEDAVEFMMAGATAVQVGTASYAEVVRLIIGTRFNPS